MWGILRKWRRCSIRSTPESPASWPMAPMTGRRRMTRWPPTAMTSRRASGSLGFLCCLGLSGLSRIIVGETGIPFLEKRAERAIERAGSGLQQQVRAALRPLHLLTFAEALADDGVHR